MMVTALLVSCSPAQNNYQDTPENLVAEILELREQGHAEEAARYFINNNIKADDREQLTAVTEDMLCSAEGVNCNDKNTTNSYWKYINNKECEDITADDVREKGVTVDDDEDGDNETVVEVSGTSDAGNACSFSVWHVDGKWWLLG